MGPRRAAILALGCASILFAPALVQAATVGFGPEGNVVEFTAATGEQNAVTISSNSDETAVSFRDTGAPLTAGPGCASHPDGSVACATEPAGEVDVTLVDGNDNLDASLLTSARLLAEGGDGDDALIGGTRKSSLQGGEGVDYLTTSVTEYTTGAFEVNGGPGDDVLTGNAANDFLVGGAGADDIVGASGPDQVAGGSGDDTLYGGTGNDEMYDNPGDDQVGGGPGDDRLFDQAGADVSDGGSGNDRLFRDFRDGDAVNRSSGGPGADLLTYLCRGCEVTLNGRADDGPFGRDAVREIENVTMKSSEPIEDLDTFRNFGSGADLVVGDDAANVIATGRGRDRIAGGSGRDRLLSGTGEDRVRAADGRRDLVNCGAAEDLAVVDETDEVDNCERVRIR